MVAPVCSAFRVEVDVTGWAVIRSEDGGADQGKRWLAENADADRVDQWLWKPRQPTADGSERELSDVSEVLASQIATLLGLPAAECRYATLGAEHGVLSKNVSPADCDLHEGRVYLEPIAGYQRNSPRIDSQGHRVGRARLDEGYTLDAVADALTGMTGPPGWEHLSAIQVFCGYLVLDALIANTDRHPGNWAVLDPWSSDTPMLAPAYDHGRALGAGLTERNRQNTDLETFCRRGKARTFTPPESLVALAQRACGQHSAAVWLDRVEGVAANDLDVLVAASGQRMSVGASTFVTQVLETNRRRLCT